VTVVADSSPLVILTKLGCFDLLNKLFRRLDISAEVYHEVVVAGAGLPGATEVANAKWVEVRNLQNQADLLAAQQNYALGVGELSTILLGKELHANAVLLDDYKARKLATAEGLQVRGSVGLLETLYLRGYLTDLRATFRQLLTDSYIDQRLLDRRLRALGLPLL
jgi:Predicted nucleic acid-binding protein, contains PIN domain